MTASLLSLFSCSDEYLEDLNTDPSKAAEIDPNAQLTTAQLQTYGDLGMVEIYRNYIYGFTQQLMGCWNTTNYGGRHTIADSEMSRWAEGDFLPNMPTSRLGASLSGHVGHFTAHVALDHYLRQKYLGKHISDEFAFPAYSLLSARLSCERQVGRAGVECYVYGQCGSGVLCLRDQPAGPRSPSAELPAALPGALARHQPGRRHLRETLNGGADEPSSVD